MARIELDHVTKRYPGGVPAVKDLSLDIPDGEFMVLVGPSGSGKSTALRMVAGLEGLTDGEVRIGGRVVNDLEPRDRDIAMVFQHYALYPHMTVEETSPSACSCTRPQARAATVGRRGRPHPRPGAVPEAQAGGAVGRAAAAGGDGPGDRPRAAGVPDGRATVQPGCQAAGVDAGAAGRAARPPGVTTVYVTHDQVEAMTAA
jgi:ABC-type Fe3+/spermidine/putrescine transport system ATPase subunit